MERNHWKILGEDKKTILIRQIIILKFAYLINKFNEIYLLHLMLIRGIVCIY